MPGTASERRDSARTAVVWEALGPVLEPPGLDVLDIGGGTGGFAVRVAGLGHRVTVVDPSPDALAALARRLNGLPIAITHSPSRSLSLSPNLTALSGLVGVTLSNARSVFWSRPITSAFSVLPSLRMTFTSSASAMT